MAEKLPSKSNDYVVACAEHLKLSRAADLLGCKPEDLLHLGVSGKIQIMSPVLCAGIYVWDVSTENTQDSLAFPEIRGPIKRVFDAAERVVLRWVDLAKIEGVGWVIPSCFYSPSHAQEIDEFLISGLSAVHSSANLSEVDDEEAITTVTRSEGGKELMSVVFSMKQKFDLDDRLTTRRRSAYLSNAWYPFEEHTVDAQHSPRTTIDHLFLSKEEFERINKRELSADAERPGRGETQKLVHGNVESNAQKRKPVYEAAIYCLANFFDQCSNNGKVVGTRLAQVIDEKAPLFWPEDYEPNLKRSTIETLIREALKEPRAE